MNSLLRSTLATAVLAATVAAPALAVDTLANDRQKVSYMVGMDLGNSLKPIKGEIDMAVVNQAIEDVLNDRKSLLSTEEHATVRQEFIRRMTAQQEAQQKAQAEKNKAAGEKFLADNKAKPGVKTTASGLQYQVITEGKGKKPTANDRVKVHYTGTLIDGTKFDSSIDRGQPVEFALNGVIPGWTEALQLMPAGSKYKLFIPSNLAYGDKAPPQIGPNSTLVFDVELLEILPAQAAPAAAPPPPKQ